MLGALVGLLAEIIVVVYCRVKVQRRHTSRKIESSGIFPGAKVVRGPNWDWGNQDGESSR